MTLVKMILGWPGATPNNQVLENGARSERIYHVIEWRRGISHLTAGGPHQNASLGVSTNCASQLRVRTAPRTIGLAPR